MTLVSTHPLTPPAVTADAVAALRGRVAGTVHGPGDDGYDAARAAWDLAVDQRPAAVVVPTGAADVVETVRAARALGLRVAPQATGHAAHRLGDLSGSVLLRTEQMRGVSIDAENALVRVEAGAQWQDVVAPAARAGLAVLHGSAPDVGVVGYTLGGGLSWQARRYGLASNHVTAIDVVTGDGRLVRADAEQHADLFWALRGGGGSAGVVTALEFRAYPAEDVYCGWLVWPWEHARTVLAAWRSWTRDLPDTVTSLARILQLPPSPDLPEPLRGRRLVVVEAAMVESEDAAVARLAPLRALAPELDTFSMQPMESLADLHRDPPPVPFAGDHAVLGPIGDAAVDAVVAAAGPGSGSTLLSVELRHLGGALSRPVPGGGARSTIDGEYLAFAVGVTPTPESFDLVAAQAEYVMNALAPWRRPVGFPNFDDSPVGRVVLDPETYERLRVLADDHDPARTVHSGLDPRPGA